MYVNRERPFLQLLIAAKQLSRTGAG